MFIQTEATPNPATLKFIPGRVVSDGSPMEFASRESAGRSPLAEKLFDVPVVDRDVAARHPEFAEALCTRRGRSPADVVDRHSGAMRGIDPEIWRFRARSFGPPRNETDLNPLADAGGLFRGPAHARRHLAG